VCNGRRCEKSLSLHEAVVTGRKHCSSQKSLSVRTAVVLIKLSSPSLDCYNRKTVSLQVAVVVQETVVVAKAAVFPKAIVTPKLSSSGQDCHSCETLVVATPL
jgi:hypothetical protein